MSSLRAISGGGLYFSFGPVDPAEEQTKGLEVGNLVREELERAGLRVEWDGKFESRSKIPKVIWRSVDGRCGESVRLRSTNATTSRSSHLGSCL